MIDKDQVLLALNDVFDPELGMSLNELNMIREVNIDQKSVQVKLVLTTPFCPLAGKLVEEVRKKTAEVAEGREVKVIVLNEPWTPPKGFRR